MGNTFIKFSITQGNWAVPYTIYSTETPTQGFQLNLFTNCATEPAFQLIIGADNNTNAVLVNVSSGTRTVLGPWVINNTSESYTVTMCDNNLQILTNVGNVNGDNLTVVQDGFENVSCISGYFVEQNEVDSFFTYTQPQPNFACSYVPPAPLASVWLDPGVLATVIALGVLFIIFFILTIVFSARAGLLWNIPDKPMPANQPVTPNSVTNDSTITQN